MISLRSAKIKSAILVILLVVLPLASGQELQEKVEVQLVQVDVSATDSKGVVVRDLTKDDFSIKENGAPQTITYFFNSADDANRYPLTVSFLVDTSYSMSETVAGLTRIDIAVKAAELVMDELEDEDQVEVIEFNNKPEAIVPFTSDQNAVLDKIGALDFREANTAMYDAILFSLDRIKDRSGRKIIVIFSDGMNTTGKAVHEDVVVALRKSDTTVISFYSEFTNTGFTTGNTNPNTMNQVMIGAGEDSLRQYAEVSGGQFFSFRKEPELAKAMESFRAIIQSQYTLAYTPTAKKQKPEFRKIKVECKRKGIKLRYREGYWSG